MKRFLLTAWVLAITLLPPATSTAAENKIRVSCPANAWTLIAAEVEFCRYSRFTTRPAKYISTFRVAGDPVPTDNLDAKVIFLSSATEEEPSHNAPVDVYVKAVGADGAVVVDLTTTATQDVLLQDPTTPVLITPMVRPQTSTTLAAGVTLNGRVLEVTDATGFVLGQHLRIVDIVNNRFYQGSIIGLSGTTVTMDMLFDFVYPAGSEVATGDINMAVDGSVTPVVFKLRIGATSIPATADVTRMIMVCETASPVDLNKFGDLAELPRGVMFRTVNGTTQNVFLVKSNRGLTGVAYDWTPYLASNPSQGIDGFGWRLTFGGQSKIGVVIRVAQDENLEFIVQDDLRGLVSLSVVIEGHAVLE